MASSKPVLKPKPQSRPQTQSPPHDKQTTWIKHHKKRNIAITAVGVAALILIIIIASLPHPSVQAGQRAPDFTLTDVNSNTDFHLNATIGKPIMLEFMRTGCEWCQKEAPILNQLFTNYPTVVFVSISIDPSTDTAAKIQEYIAFYKSPASSPAHPWYWLRDSTSSPVAATYGVDATPTMFMIDTHGTVQARVGGYKDLQPLTESLKTIL